MGRFSVSVPWCSRKRNRWVVVVVWSWLLTEARATAKTGSKYQDVEGGRDYR